jgi:signal transduction histidine kinase
MSGKKYNILFIDDEPNNLVVFKNSFFRYYNIITADSGEKGLKFLEENEIHLVITDQKMPGMTGVQFLEKVVELYPSTLRMIITAYSDIEVIIQAINKCGIYQYILKPWDSRDLKNTIDNALQAYQLAKDNDDLVAKLKRSNETLELKVQERTEELKLKNNELEEINKIKDKMFTIISHDMKDPMVSLAVLLEVLSNAGKSFSTDKVEDYLLKVQSYVRNVLDLLNNLLEWSRSRVEGSNPVLEQININKLICENMEIFQVPANLKQIRLEPYKNREELFVMGDEQMLNLVLRNLLSNAIKFSSEDGRVGVEVCEEEESIRVKVMDTGVGIPDHIREKLFINGYSHTERGTAQEKGVGLGLSLCKEFMELQDGSLQVKSKVGEGTEISFSIPKVTNEILK